MSRLSIAALILAFAAFAIGIAAPALDPAVLREQLSFAQRTADRPEAGARPATADQPEEKGLRAEATRWLTRKIRERNDDADARRAGSRPAEAEAGEEPGLFGAAARYIVPLQFILALAALGAALADWLRTHALRANVAAGLVAGAAIILPFAWSAVAAAVTVAACLIALILVGSVLG